MVKKPRRQDMRHLRKVSAPEELNEVETNDVFSHTNHQAAQLEEREATPTDQCPCDWVLLSSEWAYGNNPYV